LIFWQPQWSKNIQYRDAIMGNTKTNPSGISILPPLIIGVPFVAGMALQWVFPFQFPARRLGLALGGLCSFPAIAILVSARTAFQKARTSMLPRRRNRVLIVGGPFKFTRNPLYVGLVLLYAGICFSTGAIWPLLFMPIVVALLHWLVILPEEDYLEKRFSNEYRAYKALVRRWL